MFFNLSFTIRFYFIDDKSISATVQSIVSFADNADVVSFFIVSRLWVFIRESFSLTAWLGIATRSVIKNKSIFFGSLLLGESFVYIFILVTIVFLTWYDLTSYSIVLPVSISALVFLLWSICYMCIIHVTFTLTSSTCIFCERLSQNYFNRTYVLLL